MKKLNILLLFSVLILSFSCEDAYKIVQDGEFSDAATFKTIADMNLYLNEVYDRIDTSTEISLSSILTDEVGIGSSNAGQNLGLYNFVFNREDGDVSGIWLRHYTAINYANRLLRGAALITPIAADLAEYNSIIAQAKAIRAFCHFELLVYFSTDLKNDNALGVIKLDRVPNLTEQLPRNTNGEIFDFIDSDLQFCDINLIDHTANSYKFISKNFVSAFRARMYAYRGKYVLAQQYADDVINNSGITLTPTTTFTTDAAFYAATSTNPYRKMWNDTDKGEIIFALDRPVGKGGNVASLFYFNRTNYQGGPFHDMGRTLFNLMNDVAGDIRRKAFIDPTSRILTAAQLADPNLTAAGYKAGDVLCIDKYPGKISGADLNNDLKVFRLSEMYFIKAESLVAAGDLIGAANVIKLIRDVRNWIGPQALPVYGNATEAWVDILKERRIELCFEGHRYIDLKRLGGLANLTIDRYTKDCGNGICSIAVTDYRFTFPIPIDEIIGNSVIQQNPNY